MDEKSKQLLQAIRKPTKTVLWRII